MESTAQSPARNFSWANLPPDSRGDELVSLNASLIAISTVILVTRLYARTFLLKSLGIDDLLATLTYPLLVTLSALEAHTVNYGSGTHMDEVPPELLPKFFSRLTTMQLIYFTSVGLVRISVASFYPRLSNDKWYLRGIYATIFVTFANTMMAFFFMLTECKHIPDLWNVTAPGRQCIPKSQEAPVFWAHGAVGIAIDISLMVLPIWVIYSKMKFSSKTVQVILVFCVGIFGIVTGIVRLAININTDFTTDTPIQTREGIRPLMKAHREYSTYKVACVAPWTDLEGHIGLWTACFPAMQPALRFVSYKMGLRSTLGSTDNKSRYAYGASGAAGGGNSRSLHSKGWRNTTGQGGHSRGYLSFNGDRDGESEHGITTTAAGGNGSDLELQAVSDSGIHKTTDVIVHVADAADKQSGITPKHWDALYKIIAPTSFESAILARFRDVATTITTRKVLEADGAAEATARSGDEPNVACRYDDWAHGGKTAALRLIEANLSNHR
ncbi:Uu.00g091110.m01.CDS01 [Anthostomella pinea]|uniref:Uu.00g091110.m01.CDS01 n=1 Tax=Anthostomella pinea TaxID=933095 RepID=A0AAI8VN11_9PEZI|nr:Uu.00g091110.m01.CDS01 [Anthostomella pinea]